MLQTNRLEQTHNLWAHETAQNNIIQARAQTPLNTKPFVYDISCCTNKITGTDCFISAVVVSDSPQLQFQYSTVSGVYDLHLLCVFKIHVVKNSGEKSHFVTSDFFSTIICSVLFYPVLSTVFCSTHIACQTIFDILGKVRLFSTLFNSNIFANILFIVLFHSNVLSFPFQKHNKIYVVVNKKLCIY